MKADNLKPIIRSLESIANGDNWFHTTDEAGGPYTAWRGKGEPDELAEKVLNYLKSNKHFTPSRHNRKVGILTENRENKTIAGAGILKGTI